MKELKYINININKTESGKESQEIVIDFYDERKKYPLIIFKWNII